MKTKVKKLKRFSEIRRRNFAALTAFFKKYEKFFVLPQQNVVTKTNWLAYPLAIKKTAPFKRLEIVRYLEENNIQTRPVLTGNITKQPGFKNIRREAQKLKYPVADYIMENSFLIGCHHGLTEKHINYVKESFVAFLGRFQ